MARRTASTVLRELRAAANPADAAGALRYFKTGPGQYGEGDRFLGLRAPALRAFARTHRELERVETTKLLHSPWHEARVLALLILVEQYRRGDEAERRAIYDLYLGNTAWINNWDLVDCSAPHIVGAHVLGGDRGVLLALARSESLWERRIAIIATQHLIRAGELETTLRIASILRDDAQDLIHKAVGWMLREVGDRDRAVEERFLAEHAPHMPRTMLRYAIEKFPPALRRRYLVGCIA
jgi:3-methyladenine DNA glycosylase AlkD